MARLPRIVIPVRLVVDRPEPRHICSATIRVDVEVNGIRTGAIENLTVHSGETVTVQQPIGLDGLLRGEGLSESRIDLDDGWDPRRPGRGY